MSTDLSADIIPWEVEYGLQFQHQIKQEGLVTVLEQLDLAQRVEVDVNGQISPQVLRQSVHQDPLICKFSINGNIYLCTLPCYNENAYNFLKTMYYKNMYYKYMYYM